MLEVHMGVEEVNSLYLRNNMLKTNGTSHGLTEQ